MNQTATTHPATVSIHSAVSHGNTARQVIVQARTAPGTPGLVLTGAKADANQERTDRLTRAMQSAGMTAPLSSHVVVEVQPQPPHAGPFVEGADEGLDLAVALAALAADGQIPRQAVAGIAAVGELATNGAVTRTFQLDAALGAMSARMVLVPSGHLEISSPRGATVRRVATLREAVDYATTRASGLVDRIAPSSKPDDGRGERRRRKRRLEPDHGPTVMTSDGTRRGGIASPAKRRRPRVEPLASVRGLARALRRRDRAAPDSSSPAA